MEYRRPFVLLYAVVSLFALGQTQCPEWPKPPFDTTGLYDGTWSGVTTTETTMQNVEACPLKIHLEQDLTANYPGDHAVKGWIEIDYSCLELPAWVDETPPPSRVDINGLLTDDGKLTLLSGGCGTGLCLVLTLAGEGAIADGDETMDTYTGVWSFFILLAGVQPFGVSGVFDVTRWLEAE